MTVHELMLLLAPLDQNLPVLVTGYEGGAVDLPKVEVCRVHYNARKASYMGPHEVIDTDLTDTQYIKYNWFDDDHAPVIITAVYLPRSR